MHDIALKHATDNERIDEILQGVVGVFEMAFPARIRAYYLTGSFTEATAASFSDIDCYLLFIDAFAEGEKHRAEALCQHLRKISPIRLDLDISAEVDVENEWAIIRDVRLKLASALVYGEDIRSQLQLPDIEDYKRHICSRWAALFTRRMHDAKTLNLPIVCSDPEDEFYGYAKKRAEAWYPQDVMEGSKELVATVSWIATALLALEREKIVASRAEAISDYREQVGGEWAEYLEETYEYCKKRWDYRVPASADDRVKLREICRRMPDFANHFLALYRDYLQELLDGEHGDFAREELAKFIVD